MTDTDERESAHCEDLSQKQQRSHQGRWSRRLRFWGRPPRWSSFRIITACFVTCSDCQGAHGIRSLAAEDYAPCAVDREKGCHLPTNVNAKTIHAFLTRQTPSQNLADARAKISVPPNSDVVACKGPCTLGSCALQLQ